MIRCRIVFPCHSNGIRKVPTGIKFAPDANWHILPELAICCSFAWLGIRFSSLISMQVIAAPVSNNHPLEYPEPNLRLMIGLGVDFDLTSFILTIFSVIFPRTCHFYKLINFIDFGFVYFRNSCLLILSRCFGGISF